MPLSFTNNDSISRLAASRATSGAALDAKSVCMHWLGYGVVNTMVLWIAPTNFQNAFRENYFFLIFHRPFMDTKSVFFIFLLIYHKTQILPN